VEPGETLRQLARRTFDAVLDAKGIGVFKSGEDVWVPMFNPRTQKFDGWYGYEVCGALRPGYFDEHWQPPKDCTGDEAIEDCRHFFRSNGRSQAHRILRHELEMRDL